jgi:hypothetical protein
MRAGTHAIVLSLIIVMGCDRVFGLGDPYQDAAVPDVPDVPDVDPVRFVTASCKTYSGLPPYSFALSATNPGDLVIASVTFAGAVGDTLVIADDRGHDFTLHQQKSFFQQAEVLSLADIPGGDTTLTADFAVGSGGSSPIRMCVAEYGNVATTPVVNSTVVKLSNGTPGLETIEGLAMAPPSERGLVYIAVFDGRDDSLSPGPGLDVRASSLSSALVEDTPMAIDPTRVLATLTSSTTGPFDEWIAFALALDAR